MPINILWKTIYYVYLYKMRVMYGYVSMLALVNLKQKKLQWNQYMNY